MPLQDAARIRADSLFRELSASFQLELTPYQIEGVVYQLHKVTNIDDLLDELMARPDDDIAIVDERLPYWADIWPAAIGLATYISNSPIIGPDTKVLELGCGMGLCGIAAARKGATVTMTDYLPEALHLAELNAIYNEMNSVRFVEMDWREPDASLQADVILASDVAYEQRAFAPLFRAFETLLKPGGHILLSEPRREIARPFLNALPKQGFQAEQSTWPVEFQNREVAIDVYEIRISR